jgi:AraC family transcriptional regulator, transcriptional activator of pobA
MINDGIPLLSMEQAIADFEGQWKGKDFYVVTSGTTGARRHLIPCPFRTDYMAVFLTVEGSALVRLNQTEYALKKNSLMIVSPRTVRELAHFSTDASVMGLIFTRHFLAENGIQEQHLPLFDYFLLHHSPHLSLDQADADILTGLMTLLQQKSRETKDKPYLEEIVRHHFMAFLYELASLYRKHTGRKIKRTRKEDLHLRFHQLLSAHVREERSVRFYAAKLFVTPKYLTETAKVITGKTAGELIDEMVMREAKLLLSDPALSVTEIAGALHFSDQFFFRKFFKRHQGRTPSEFRREE